MSDVLSEVRRAEDLLHSLNLQWFGETGITPESVQARAEASAERFAIQIEGAPAWRPGLVSVPTSGRASVGVPPTPFSVTAAAVAVREAVDGFVPDPKTSRLARLRMCVGAAARAVEALKVKVEQVRTIMVTLTYRGTNADWEPRHVSDFLKRCRAWAARVDIPFRYVWVAELQKRGVIHYHVAIWAPPGVHFPKPDEAGWWPHGMTRIETARHAVAYLMKYLTKGNEATQGGFPKGARVHGRGGLGGQFRAVIRWLSLPAFIQARASVDDRWQRVKGGGWASPEGEWFPSEFERVQLGPDWGLRRVHNHGRPFEVAGPWSRLCSSS